jgi:hypothetical protein
MKQKEIADTIMPEKHRPYLDSYVCTPDDRQRRLKLAKRFIPGAVSEKLKDAVFWVEPRFEGIYEDTSAVRGDMQLHERNEVTEKEKREELQRIEEERRREDTAWMNVARKRKEMPWYEGMMRWGYPPGWYSERGEFHFCPPHRFPKY